MSFRLQLGTPLAAARLAMTFNDLVAEFNTVGFVCRKSGTYFGRGLAAGTFYRLGRTSEVDGSWPRSTPT